MTLEVCVDSYETALLAAQYQAKRIELCSALSVGGLTPSLALVQQCISIKSIETHVMIRPREGDFYYNNNEIESMSKEIEFMAKIGVHGLVFGCLDMNNNIDVHHNELLIKIAKSKGLETTFHRAFDFVKNPLESLESLISMGFDRLLTSGQKKTAIDGKELIKSLVFQSKGRIQIMAGSGINKENALSLASLGIDALHFTSHKKQGEDSLGMGYKSIPNEEKIKSISNLFQ